MSSSSRITRRWSPDTSSSLANWSFSACSMSRFALSNFSVVVSKSLESRHFFLFGQLVLFRLFNVEICLEQFLRSRVQIVLHVHNLLSLLQDFVISVFEDAVEFIQPVCQGVLLILRRLLQTLKLEHFLLDGLHRVRRCFFCFGRHLGG